MRRWLTSIWRRFVRFELGASAIVMLGMLSTRPAMGDGDDVKQEVARSSFEQGVRHAQNGEFLAAIRAFEAAYVARPHYSVLYNIAQAQVALERPLEAVESFERYLKDGGNQIGSARRAQTQALVDANRKHIGAIKISVAAGGLTRVWLDGVELVAEQLDQPLLVNAGKHRVMHSDGSTYPVVEDVLVLGMTTKELRLPAPAPIRPEMAQLTVSCDVPAVEVMVDGRVAAMTPIPKPLLVPSGQRAVSFRRPGYNTVQRSIFIRGGTFTTTACEILPQVNLVGELKGLVEVHTNPAQARIVIDGQPLSKPTLPIGAHELRVEHSGYLPYRRIISIVVNRVNRFDIALLPTAVTAARWDAARARKRTAGFWLGGAGALAMLAGGSTYLWNGGRYEDWRSQRGTDHTRDLDRVASMQRVDDLSLGLTVLGVGLVAGAAWTILAPAKADE